MLDVFPPDQDIDPTVGRAGWGPTLALSSVALAGTTRLATGRWRLVGLNVAETTGAAPARVRVWDAGDTSNLQLLVASASVPANSSTQPGGMGDGLLIERGLVVQVVFGTADVTLFVRHAY